MTGFSPSLVIKQIPYLFRASRPTSGSWLALHTRSRPLVLRIGHYQTRSFPHHTTGFAMANARDDSQGLSYWLGWMECGWKDSFRRVCLGDVFPNRFIHPHHLYEPQERSRPSEPSPSSPLVASGFRKMRGTASIIAPVSPHLMG